MDFSCDGEDNPESTPSVLLQCQPCLSTSKAVAKAKAALAGKYESEVVRSESGRSRGSGEDNPSLISASSMLFTCMLCNKKFPVCERVPGHHWDRECKRAYDSLRRHCVRQNELEWFNSIKDNPKVIKKAVLDFMKQNPSGVGRGKRRAPGYKVCELKERLTTKTSLERRDQGKLMWEDEYIQWAESVEGGKLPRWEAHANWNRWADRNSGVYRDDAGPKEKPLRLRIIIGTFIDSLNIVEVAKEVEQRSQAMRNVTDEQLAQMRSSVFSGHERIMGIQNMNTSDIIDGMLSHENSEESRGLQAGVGSGAFDMDGVSTVDLRAAGIIGGKKRGIEDSDGPDEDQEEKGDSQEADPRPKRVRYYDSARLNAASATKWHAQMEKLAGDARNIMAKIKDLLSVHDRPDNVHYESVKLTLKVAKERMEVSSLVFKEGGETGDLAADNAALQEFLSKFSTPPGDGQSAPPPPIQKYKSLVLAALLDKDGQDKFMQCASHEESKDITKSLHEKKTAVQEVISVCSAAEKDINKAVAAAEKVMKVQAKLMISKNQTSGSASSVRKPDSCIWEAAVTKGTPIASVKCGDPAPTNGFPFIVTSCDFFRDNMVQGTDLFSAVSSFRMSFDDWRLKCGKNRGGKVVKTCEWSTKLKSDMEGIFTSGDLVSIGDKFADNPEFSNIFSMQHFAMAPSMDHISTEVEKLGSLRMTAEGTRAVVMMPLNDLRAFSKTLYGLNCDQAKSVPKVLGVVESFTHEQFSQYIDEGFKAYHGTVGPNDMLYTPVGFASASRCHRHMVTGFLFSLALNCDVGQEETKSMYAWLAESATPQVMPRVAMARSIFDS